MSGQPNRILIVDDDVSTLKILVAILNKQGYMTTLSTDGAEAWQQIKANPGIFDLVLLDRQMPGMDGISLLRLMKAEKSLQHIPVILQTCLSEADDFIEGFQSGAHGYLVKPINAKLLLAMIKSTIRIDYARSNLKRELAFLQTALHLTVKSMYRFRTLEEAEALACLLGNICPVSDRSRNGLYELFVNAVEHGNLDISYSCKSRLMMENRWKEEVALRLEQPQFRDRIVSVDIEQQSEGFSVLICDQGNGFDFESYLDFSPDRIFDLHGKGIAMANKLYLDEVEYLGSGNQVRAFIKSICLPDKQSG